MPHIHEKIDFCAEVFVVFQNTVLLRQHDKYKIWCSVGGHIELGEDPNAAAVREVKEEVGLEVVLFAEPDRQPNFTNQAKSLIPPQYLTQHPINAIHEHIVFIYFATTKTNELKLSATEITDGCKWFTKEELLKNDYDLQPDVQFYALKALEKLST